MFTSVIDKRSKQSAKIAFIYLLISVFCGAFGAIYELFSHGVYSFFMIYAFSFPLLLGTLPFFSMSLLCIKKYPERLSMRLYHCGIAALTVGSIICGILDIYGTTNSLTNCYWVFGFVLLLSGIITYLIDLFSDSKKNN